MQATQKHLRGFRCCSLQNTGQLLLLLLLLRLVLLQVGLVPVWVDVALPSLAVSSSSTDFCCCNRRLGLRCVSFHRALLLFSVPPMLLKQRVCSSSGWCCA